MLTARAPLALPRSRTGVASSAARKNYSRGGGLFIRAQRARINNPRANNSGSEPRFPDFDVRPSNRQIRDPCTPLHGSRKVAIYGSQGRFCGPGTTPGSGAILFHRGFGRLSGIWTRNRHFSTSKSDDFGVIFLTTGRKSKVNRARFNRCASSEG